MRIGLATCKNPGSPHVSDEDVLVEALRARGADVAWLDWADPGIDWSAWDAVWIRTTWDYHQHLDAYLDWTDRVGAQTRLFNPPDVVRWNADKAYLDGLAELGVPVIPSTVLRCGAEPSVALEAAFEAFGPRVMLKPSVGAGSDGTCLVDGDDGGSVDAARRHLGAWLCSRTMRAQPLIDVASSGEASVVCVDHIPQHAVLKYPCEGSWKVQEEHGGRTEEAAMTAAMVSVARSVLEGVGRTLSLDGPLLQARVDLLPYEGSWHLLEVELIEPTLYLAQGRGTADQFSEAMLRRLS